MPYRSIATLQATRLGYFRRVIATSIIIIITLVSISFFVTQMLLVYHKQLDSIRVNIGEQLQTWERIERVMLFRVGGTVEEAYATEVLGKKMQARVAKELMTSNAIAAELNEQFNTLHSATLSRIIGPGFNKREMAINVDQSILDSVEKYTKLPFELLVLADQIWDVGTQISFRSGKYMDPLQTTRILMESRKQEVQQLSNMVFIICNIGLVIGIILIWRYGLTPAFEKMNIEHGEKMTAISKLAERSADFQASFFALEQASVIIGEGGEILHCNPLFVSLSKKHHINANIFDFLYGKNIVSQTEKKVNVRSVEELSALCEQDNIILINQRHFSISCSNVTEKRWILLFGDHEKFMQHKESELNKKRLETLDYISGGVAHDFNNILGSILSRAELMEMELANNVGNESSILDIKRIINSCERGKVVTSNLLSYARQKKLNKQRMTTSELLNAVKEQIIVPKNIDMKLTNNLNTVIDADIMQLVTAIDNLVRNAIDAIGERVGHIQILIDKDEEYPDMACILVNDSGEGFTRDAMKQASDPFYSTKTLQHGNGLGLSMVAGFISQSSGLLSYGNLKAGGAFVKILLPIEDGVVAEKTTISQTQSPIKEATSPHLKAKRCLIIEDNIEISKSLQMYFKSIFGDISIASSCIDAKKTIDGSEAFDLVICDWTLPDGDSQELIENIISKSPSTKVVVVTGNIGKKLEIFSQTANLTIYEKPISLHKLREHILDKIQKVAC